MPSGGKVYVKGMDTADENNIFNIRQSAGMVFQNPDNQMVAALVEDEVAFAPKISVLSLKRYADVLTSVLK